MSLLGCAGFHLHGEDGKSEGDKAPGCRGEVGEAKSPQAFVGEEDSRGEGKELDQGGGALDWPYSTMSDTIWNSLAPIFSSSLALTSSSDRKSKCSFGIRSIQMRPK